ncbi:ATP-binding protein [Halopelagius longus]|uniref:Protoporphyrin IX magnesium-chelatase n=1 Tax=Halopelagius longus TaxID=1236180 RepID=A0A1H0ZFN9_9EURY|nr:ATP-binding protein [Halopelagius longus]RDI70268.1 VWA domain-containing protein [Halopelagius longus]SDQ26202.1 protoporphyrin IX magnesium-chelatase [Halopelagius longus]
MVDFGRAKKASYAGGTSLSFSEIVGQEELKSALLTVGANAALDGLLIRGEKGTAKSTAVRALADLLPTQEAVEDCPYGCPPNAPEKQCADCRDRTDPPTTERSVPLVTLPLGATRERVVGTLSVADALDGQHEFDPGLLARANRGILYVDEVNLLDDHLVDVLLDAAASGVNTVERDGVSVSHPADFTLVGTMNPEEGELRPQLRDRFALQATVTACEDIDRRVEIIDRATGRTDVTPANATDAPDDGRGIDDPRGRLRRARKRLPEVELPTQFARDIAELCRDSGIEGHRGDIAAARAAATFAALEGRSKVVESDVRRAAELALPHRLRSRPFEDAPDPEELLDDHFDEGSDDGRENGEDGQDEAEGEGEADGEDRAERDGQSDSDEESADETGDADDASDSTPDSTGPDDESDETDDGNDGSDGAVAPSPRNGGGADDEAEANTDGSDGETDESDGESGESDEQTEGTPIVPGQSRAGVGEAAAPDLSAPEAVERGKAGGGSRSRTRPSVDDEGARVRSQRADSNRGIDAAASVRAATARGAPSVESRDLRQSVRRSDASALVLFAVDASASMLPAMRAAKGTVLELLKDAYQKRDEVAFVAFAGDEADVLLPPTNSVTLAARHLKDLPTGDRTPLPAGLRTAGDVLERADPAAGVVVLVTDGRANVAEGSPVRETRAAARRLTELGAHVVVVDAGDDDRAGLTGTIADETGGERVPLSALSAERIDAAVGAARET